MMGILLLTKTWKLMKLEVDENENHKMAEFSEVIGDLLEKEMAKEDVLNLIIEAV